MSAEDNLTLCQAALRALTRLCAGWMQGLIGLISTDFCLPALLPAFGCFWQVTRKNCLLHSQTPGDSAGLSVLVWVCFFYARASALDRGTPGPLVASSAPSC